MKHKTRHHKFFIILFIMLMIAITYFFSRGLIWNEQLQIILTMVNSLLLIINLEFMLDLYSGNKILKVEDVTKSRRSATRKPRKK